LFITQLFVRLRESSKQLNNVDQTPSHLPEVTTTSNDSARQSLFIVDTDNTIESAVGRLVNIEFVAVDLGRESVDVCSSREDKSAAAAANDDMVAIGDDDAVAIGNDPVAIGEVSDFDCSSSSTLNGELSAAANSSAASLTEYKVYISLFI